MVRCRICNEEVDMPFICSYCNGPYCVNHKLPENHSCPNLWAARRPVRSEPDAFEFHQEHKEASRTRRPGFISSEIRDLTIAWLVLGFCFSVRYLWGALSDPAQFIQFFGISLLTVGCGFVFHEMAHKFTAQRYGCRAGFRLWRRGLMMALFLAIISGGRFIFAAPGAVYVDPSPKMLRSGYGITQRENGIMSVSGPAANIILGLIFLLIASLGGIIGIIGLYGFRINFFLAAFNLLPFGMFDGQKVFSWNKSIWAAVTIPIWLMVLFSWI